MISEDFAFEQVDRLSGLRFFPNKPSGVLELVKALRSISRTEAEAEGYVDLWIAGNSESPTPANVYELSTQQARSGPVFNPEEESCPDCLGTGWVVLLGPMPRHLAATQSRGALRCECMRRTA